MSVLCCVQVKSALSDEAVKAGVLDTPESIFSYLIERVRNNLHIILCMSPVGDPFRYVPTVHCIYCLTVPTVSTVPTISTVPTVSTVPIAFCTYCLLYLLYLLYLYCIYMYI